MSYTKEKKERIIRYILEKIDSDEEKLCSKVATTFETSDTTIRRYLRELTKDGIISQNKLKKCGYELKTIKIDKLYLNKNLQEDYVYGADFYSYLKDIPENIEHICSYAFTEMLNNAIEHSDSETIYVSLEISQLTISITIMDHGIGIFNNIANYMKRKYTRENVTIEDAVIELFKGKLTTAEENHSGEGIFFTSRMMDKFFIISSNTYFSHDNLSEYMIKEFVDSTLMKEGMLTGINCGTLVHMKISNHSKKTTKEVFDMFAPSDTGFVKTNIPIQQTCCEFGYPVSRSQARRLCARFEEFEEIILDFKDVPNIGQGFAHEIFNVFQKKHPKLKIIVQNAIPYVEGMIERVKN